MIKPDYEREGVRLYCGDCLEILPQFEDGSVDAVVTDPPYGIGFGGPRTNPRKIIGDDAPFDPSPLLRFDCPKVLWGANAYASRLPDSYNWLVWLKRGEKCAPKTYSDCEMAWTEGCVKGGVKRFVWDGNIRQKDYEMRRLHPTQKPVYVMEWAVGYVPSGTILDPFMGSGTTGVACVNTGRDFIGIELDRGYFDIACERIDKALDEKAERLPLETAEA